jgi:hypothetical protein
MRARNFTPRLVRREKSYLLLPINLAPWRFFKHLVLKHLVLQSEPRREIAAA